ncbi:hypothetical protein KGQ20_23510 [Catenulispora sp. NF23]|uniref:ribosome-inactivating family protein n=1 Tax=Catenulispora pinistramenti TaxID=2705254 RepID=UPI001BACD8BF|nr:ribosome-inactivating family protein [Catenulispora pinistramenti]MBS2535733.1 hypothetical protein [Catenulispora pinistramenti]
MRIAAFLVTVSLAMMAVVTSTGVAKADTPANGVGHVYLNLSSPSPTAQSDYGSFISSLRAAAGHPYRQGVYVTQPSSNALIRVDVTAPGGEVLWLWLTPGDLYVRGFTSQTDNITYYFADYVNGTPTFNMQTVFQSIGNNSLLPASRATSILDFGSNYNSMVQAAGRGRESMPISFNDLVGSVVNLANTGYPYGSNQQAIARSLMYMIQYTSESARFWDVYGVMAATMVSWSGFYNGLPILQQYLENSWDQISQYGFGVSQNPGTGPVNVNGVGTFSSWNDVAARMAILLAAAYVGYDPNGNWAKTEL